MERNNNYGTKSRYLFTAKGHYGEKFKSVKTEFTRVFRKYGLPRQVHTDNGSPFGSTPSIQRFTKLSYWFIDLGIMPVFSDPAHPEQNGRHERMHRDLKAECVSPAGFDMRSQTPFPERIREHEYPSNMKVMNVTMNGSVRWKSYYWVFITQGLSGKQIGVEEIGNEVWKVFYRNVFLGYFNEKDIGDKEKSTRLSTNLV